MTKIPNRSTMIGLASFVAPHLRRAIADDILNAPYIPGYPIPDVDPMVVGKLKDPHLMAESVNGAMQYLVAADATDRKSVV